MRKTFFHQWLSSKGKNVIQNLHTVVVQDSSLVTTAGSGCCRDVAKTIFRHKKLQAPASYCYDFLGSRKNLKTLGCCKRKVTFTRYVCRVIQHTRTSANGREFFSNFYVSLTVHLSIIFSKWPTWRTILLFYNTFITVLYMFRATSCSSSGGQIVLLQHWYRHSENKWMV